MKFFLFFLFLSTYSLAMDTESVAGYENDETDKDRLALLETMYDGIRTMYIEYRVLSQLYGIDEERKAMAFTLFESINQGQETVLHVLASYFRMPLRLASKCHCFLYEYHHMKLYIGTLIGRGLMNE